MIICAKCAKFLIKFQMKKFAVKLEPEMRVSERYETDQNSIVRYAEP